LQERKISEIIVKKAATGDYETGVEAGAGVRVKNK